jgi:hypothetical protein
VAPVGVAAWSACGNVDQARRFLDALVAQLDRAQTSNLRVGSSNLFGRAKTRRIYDYPRSATLGGKLKPLGITTLKSSEQLPGVKPVAEQGVPGFEMAAWNACYAPRDTPQRAALRDCTKQSASGRCVRLCC